MLYFLENKRALSRPDLAGSDKFLVTIKSVQEVVKDFPRELGYQDNCSRRSSRPSWSRKWSPEFKFNAPLKPKESGFIEAFSDFVLLGVMGELIERMFFQEIG